jgi:hypothetical protein
MTVWGTGDWHGCISPIYGPAVYQGLQTFLPIPVETSKSEPVPASRPAQKTLAPLDSLQAPHGDLPLSNHDAFWQILIPGGHPMSVHPLLFSRTTFRHELPWLGCWRNPGHHRSIEMVVGSLTASHWEGVLSTMPTQEKTYIQAHGAGPSVQSIPGERYLSFASSKGDS